MCATVADLKRPAKGAHRTPDRRDAIASRKGLPAGDDMTQTLEHGPAAAGAARAITSAVLESWHLDRDVAESVVLVVSELVTNAVEHALPPVALHLHREPAGDHLWVGVTDGGPAPNEGAWTSSCKRDEHGRGLAVIQVLAVSHGTRTHPGNTATHWARLAVHEVAV